MKKTFNGRAIASGLIVPVAVIALWQLVCVLGWVSPLKLPSPLAVALRWGQYISPAEAYTPEAGSWLAWAFSGELLRDAIQGPARVAHAIGPGGQRDAAAERGQSVALGGLGEQRGDDVRGRARVLFEHGRDAGDGLRVRVLAGR